MRYLIALLALTAVSCSSSTSYASAVEYQRCDETNCQYYNTIHNHVVMW